MRAALVGHGRMGRAIEELLAQKGAEIAGIVDLGLFGSLFDIPGKIDVAIDFSYPGNLDADLRYAMETGCALVIGTTGLDDAALSRIEKAARRAPILYSANYSLGVALLRRAVALVAPALGEDFDIEITETHHRLKADAPSGTAKMLHKAVDPAGEKPIVYGREGLTGKRGGEIGLHSLRGGTEAGEHSVYFFGEDESLCFTHRAASRRVFAAGAVRAALFLVGRPNGLYGIDDLFKGGEGK